MFRAKLTRGETQKCWNERCQNGDFENYLVGKGIDIGAGPDQLVVHDGIVHSWDVGDGDAALMRGVEDGQFDFVYSSHCLEHLADIDEALRNWIRICRRDGHIYIVVPDWHLYEHNIFPFQFNKDHKWAFTLDQWEDKSRNLVNVPIWLLHFRNQVMVKELKLNDKGYDYALDWSVDQTIGMARAQIEIILKKIS
jgi:SAM-dependent methyltransferase